MMPPREIQRGFLKSCENEQLQFSGAIQNHGAFFIFQSEGAITHRSENLNQIISATSLQKDKAPSAIVEFSRQLELTPGARLFGNDFFAGREIDFLLTRAENGAILAEVYPSDKARKVPRFLPPPALLSFDCERDLLKAREELIQWIAQVTGFDRVMYYQFLSSGEGEVLNETTQSGAQGSYLGLRFPASDIPQIARKIYVKNPFRTIADAAAEPVVVHCISQDPELIAGVPIPDLTLVDLRSVSPIHAVYMQNMGDLASFTIPMIAGSSELDALISCHSATPGFLPLPLQQRISEHCRLFNSLSREFQTRQRVRLLDEFSYHTRVMIDQLLNTPADKSWEYLGQWLTQQFDADGCALLGEQIALEYGETPGDAVLYAIDHKFSDETKEIVFQTDHLQSFFPEQDMLTTLAGFSAVAFTAKSGIKNNLYLFRREVIQEVNWGGNPDKPVEQHDGVLGIAPRQSFARWIEKKMGHSRPWSNSTRFKLLHLRSVLGQHLELFEEIED